MYRYIMLATLGILASPALAEELICTTQLTALQRWVGYLSFIGLIKTAAVMALAVGLCLFFGGFIMRVWLRLWILVRQIVDVLAHLVSVSLIVAGAFVPEAYQLWPVLGGCLLFAGSVLLTIKLRHLNGKDPSAVFALLMVVWGAVAMYYLMPEVGFLAVIALMGLLRFSVIVTPLCYSFGFTRESDVATTTGAALMLLLVYVSAHVLYPGDMPPILSVFTGGIFWLGSFVGFCGLLILSSTWMTRRQGSYAWLQLVTVTTYLVSLGVGMALNINPLAGIAGTFFVFYIAEKLAEMRTEGMMLFGLKLMLIGGVLSGAWFMADKNEALVQQYLTTQLPF